MKKKTSFILGIILLITAVCFVMRAANHPELSFPWSNSTTYTIYGAYIWLTFELLLDIPFYREKRISNPDKPVPKIVVYSSLVFMQLLNKDLTGVVRPLCRGFVILGGADLALENLLLLIKQHRSN